MKKKILSMLIVISLMFLILATSAFALSFTATMKASSSTVPESTEFTITVKVSNLDVGSNGINSLSGYLKYDSEVFETISESSIEGLNSWDVTFDESTQNIRLTKNTFVTSAQEVFQITFKTKTGVSGKTGSISYSNVVASNSESDISATDISTQITIGTASEGTENTTGNITVISANTANTNVSSNNTTTNTNTIVSSVNTINTTTNNTSNNTITNTNTVSGYVNTMTNTTAEEDMPDTGVDDTVLGLIFIVIAVAIIFYVKIEKLNKDMY